MLENFFLSWTTMILLQMLVVWMDLETVNFIVFNDSTFSKLNRRNTLYIFINNVNYKVLLSLYSLPLFVKLITAPPKSIWTLR